MPQWVFDLEASEETKLYAGRLASSFDLAFSCRLCDAYSLLDVPGLASGAAARQKGERHQAMPWAVAGARSTGRGIGCSARWRGEAIKGCLWQRHRLNGDDAASGAAARRGGGRWHTMASAVAGVRLA